MNYKKLRYMWSIIMIIIVRGGKFSAILWERFTWLVRGSCLQVKWREISLVIAQNDVVLFKVWSILTDLKVMPKEFICERIF